MKASAFAARVRPVLFLAAALFAGAAWPQAATYDTGTRQLTLPSVRVGNTIYTDVVLRLDSFAILGVGGVGTPDVPATCPNASLTYSKFNAVANGMSLAQVNQIMGCQPNPTYTQQTTYYRVYIWFSADGTSGIGVFFDPAGNAVSSDFGAKFAMGVLY